MSARRSCPIWRVTLAEHDVPPRWRIPAQVVEVPAVDAEHACWRVLAWAHSDAGVPPWKPLLRVSLEHASAKRVGEVSSRDEICPPAHTFEQLELAA